MENECGNVLIDIDEYECEIFQLKNIYQQLTPCLCMGACVMFALIFTHEKIELAVANCLPTKRTCTWCGHILNLAEGPITS